MLGQKISGTKMEVDLNDEERIGGRNSRQKNRTTLEEYISLV